METKKKLEEIYPHKLRYQGKLNCYFILGKISQDFSTLEVTFLAEDYGSGKKERVRIDLYDRQTTSNFARQIAEQFNEEVKEVEAELSLLTDLLEKHRESQVELSRRQGDWKKPRPYLSPDRQKQAVQFLSGENLIIKTDGLIEKAGIAGEEKNRLLLFLIALSYKMPQPLNLVVTGSPGSGKGFFIKTIASCIPSEDVLVLTRATSKSFYHYKENDLVSKLIVIPDYDGFDEESAFAFREMQSGEVVNSSITYKDELGNLQSKIKSVRSHFSSLVAATKEPFHLSKSILVGVDESPTQTQRVTRYMGKKLSGALDETQEEKAKQFLQDCVRCLKPFPVINPYAERILLPAQAKMPRRLFGHFLQFIRQVTLFHQYQREKDERGRLITQREDIRIACDILFGALMERIDDMDSTLRQFFEGVKQYVKTQQPASGKKTETLQFTQRDVRLYLRVSKTQCFRYFESLEQLEYIQRTGGYANRGFKYKIVFWDDAEKLKEKIKSELAGQLIKLSDAA